MDKWVLLITERKQRSAFVSFANHPVSRSVAIHAHAQFTKKMLNVVRTNAVQTSYL